MAYYSTRGRFPGLIFPMIWYNSFYSTDRLMQDFGIKIEKTGFIVENDKRGDFLYPLSAVKILEINSYAKIVEKGYLDKLEKKFGNDLDAFNHFLQSNEKKDVSKLTNAQLMELYTQYNSLFAELNYLPFIIIKFGLEILIKEVQKFKLTSEDFDCITRPIQLPYLFEYEWDILNGKANDAEKLCQKWYWIPYDYYGADEWTVDHFRSELEKPKDQKKLDYLKNYSQTIQEQQEQVIKKYNLDENQQNQIRLLQRISYLQDIRKKVTNASYPFYQKKIIETFSSRTGIPKELLWLMTPSEIQQALSEKASIADLTQRKTFCAIEINGNDFVVHLKRPDYLKNEDEGERNSHEIRGTSASAGIVTGKVHVCKTSRDAMDLIEGEILVAPATTPDFVLGMAKAAAIITDEGGLTSHAAIVSREMKKPCIIATKNASSRLKTGDLVEVDANTGKIRILHRA